MLCAGCLLNFLLFSDDPAQIRDWLGQLTERLACFRLTIHPQAQPRLVTKGISFLGFRTFPDRRRLKRRKGIYFQRKFNRLVAAYADGAISLAQLTASVQGWVNHTRYGNTIGLRKAIVTARTIPPPLVEKKRINPV
jgi:RNA-directed DNA polymerase